MLQKVAILKLAQFSKADLVEIAKAHEFRGYSKFGKQKLIEWLIANLLEESYFKDYILHADIEEIKPYIVRKIQDLGLEGYSFFFYVLPFNDAPNEKTQIMEEVYTGGGL